MPTVDIIGYLWSRRQDLELYSLPDVIQFTSDLMRGGLECIRVRDIEIFGFSTGLPSIEYVRKEAEDWESLVHNAIIAASVEGVIHMSHEVGDEG